MALPFQFVAFRRLFASALVLAILSLSSVAQAPAKPPVQTQQDSSSSSDQPASTQSSSGNAASRIRPVEAGGSAITLETSEPLFDLAVALNACGYDTDLATSNPVRQSIRQQVNAALADSAPGRDSRDALCTYIRQHTLTDPGLNLAQYVSLALYVTPGPELTTVVDQSEMPPDSTQVVNILPLLRTFSENIHLHAIWIERRPEYEALVNQVHDPLTHMVLETNIFLHMPVSTYDGRRFLVLLEPMLSPAATNARIYANDYIVVTSPLAAAPGSQPDKANGGVRMNEIRHTYLHYMVEPLIYARAAAMDRLLPLLRPVQNSPLDFAHKSDIVALLTECLIKAVEDQTMDVGFPKPKRVDTGDQRVDAARFDAEISTYNRQAEIARRQAVQRDVRHGWVLVEYFYAKLGSMEKDGVSLKDDIGEMVYGMDVDRERHHDEQIVFAQDSGGGSDFVRHVAQAPTGLRLAEMKMMQGDLTTAQDLAEKALADPNADHAEAQYVLARLELMNREPDEAITHFTEVLKTSKDPRTIAWSHIYLGRLFDIQSQRSKAVGEYKAALATRDSRPDTKVAAEVGLKQAFALPKREVMPTNQSDRDDEPFDPSGKAEKEAYQPSRP